MMLGAEASAGDAEFCMYEMCRGEGGGGRGDDAEDAGLVVDGGELEEVQQFCYLGDVLGCEAGVERAVRVRVAATWGRWREISSLLVNLIIELRSRGRVYEACVRSALLYGAETRALTNRLIEVLRSCDRRMLRYMAGVRWQDGRSSGEVTEMCGVEDLSAKLRHLSAKLRQRRLRWFGHVERAGGGALNELRELRVEGRRPTGRPKKKWSGRVREDITLLEIEEHMAQDRKLWRTVITRPTSP